VPGAHVVAEEVVTETVQSTAPLAEIAPAPLGPAPAAEAAPVARQTAAEQTVAAPPPATTEPAKALQASTASPSSLKIEWPADLQQVETNRERLQAALQSAGDDGAPRRVKRVRPPVEVISSEPLQQVETRS
jgi:hypothetical protein